MRRRYDVRDRMSHPGMRQHWAGILGTRDASNGLCRRRWSSAVVVLSVLWLVGCRDSLPLTIYTAAELPQPIAVVDAKTARLDFVRPRDLVVSEEGWAFLDAGTAQVAALSLDLGVDTAWGRAGEGPDELDEPVSLAALGDSAIAVLERGRDAISIWRDGHLVDRIKIGAGSRTYVIASGPGDEVCWPTATTFRQCIDLAGNRPRGLPWITPENGKDPVPFPSLLTHGLDGRWYRFENTTAQAFREAGDGVDTLPIPPELAAALAIPEDAFRPVRGQIDLGFGSVRDFAVGVDGDVYFVLQHPRDCDLIRWIPSPPAVRCFRVMQGAGRVWAIALQASGAFALVRDGAIDLYASPAEPPRGGEDSLRQAARNHS